MYNADESGLNWRSFPRKTLVTAEEHSAPGRKIRKDRVTILFCANASGSHKLPLMIIGKSKNPKCFKSDEDLPVIYKIHLN